MPPVSTIATLFEELSSVGNEEALEALHNLCFYRLYKLAYSLLGNKETAEEVTNDVFIKIWQRRELLRDVRNPEYYLLKCVRNAALAQLRGQKQQVQHLEAFEDREGEFYPFSVEWKSTPEQILISSEMVLHINKAIDQLSPKCKLIFLLIKESNLKYQEVADLLDLSIKTVEAQMSIALKRISSSIEFSLVR
jgi:RNA polymerase sigma-70 factor (family 1)